MLVFLDKLLGLSPKILVQQLADALEYTFSMGSFGVLMIFYVFVFVVPIFVYFCRRFEICE